MRDYHIGQFRAKRRLADELAEAEAVLAIAERQYKTGEMVTGYEGEWSPWGKR